MLKFKKLSELIDNTSTGLRTIIAIVVFAGAMLTSLTGVRALLALPVRLEQHIVETQTQTQILRTQLCITVADHRRMDWTLCYTNPNTVLPR